jgi:hypothetical protein
MGLEGFIIQEGMVPKQVSTASEIDGTAPMDSLKTLSVSPHRCEPPAQPKHPLRRGGARGSPFCRKVGDLANIKDLVRRSDVHIPSTKLTKNTVEFGNGILA